MGDELRPIGGYYVKQRDPKPYQTNWRPPFMYRTLKDAFDAAEKLARKEGVSFSVMHEVGSADPVLAKPLSETERLQQELAEHDRLAADRRAALLAQLEDAGGSAE